MFIVISLTFIYADVTFVVYNPIMHMLNLHVLRGRKVFIYGKF